MEIKRKDLIAAAKELNELLNPDPKIKIVAVKTDKLEADVISAGKLVEEGDKVSEATAAVLKELLGDESDAAADVPDFVLNDLITLAGEMNKVMELDPPIEIPDDVKFESLEKEIKDNAVCDGICEIYVTDDFTEDAWMTLDKLGIEAIDPDTAAKTEKEEKKTTPAKKDKTAAKKTTPAKKDKKDKAEKKPGVIASIINIVKTKGPISKEDILKEMVILFPERVEKSMKSTIGVQIPGRINKDRDFDVVDNGKGWEVKK